MLSMLHMLRPEHPFFSKDFVRAPRQVHASDPLAREDAQHNLYKQALQGMPLPTTKRRKKAGGVASCLVKQVKAQNQRIAANAAAEMNANLGLDNQDPAANLAAKANGGQQLQQPQPLVF